ncbi:HGGxSTG domain-containing protein [Sphingomonas sp. Root1294]
MHPQPIPSAQPDILAAAPRCGARTRSGQPCRSPAVNGRRRCRMHGGKGSGAPRGNANAVKHGWYSGRVRAIVRYLRATSPGNFGRRVAVVAAGGGGGGGAEDLPRPPIPAASKRKNIKFEDQPHAPGVFAKGSQLDATGGAPRWPDRRGRALASRDSGLRRKGAVAKGKEKGPDPLGKENLARPQASLICATR